VAADTRATDPLSAGVGAPGRARIPERTLRRDRWWLQPALTVAGLTAWLLYGLVRTATQENYWVPAYHYLTPFASPCLSTSCEPGSAHFGTPFGDFPPLVPLAILTLPFLLAFRLTCYYYRKAYYRSFWLSPPACAVAEPHAKYTGETRFPLLLQNAHRYFFYVAVLISLINTYDALVAFHGRTGGFGLGLGNIVLLGNVVLLWAYTLSCHSCRHITAGRINHFSRHPVRYRLWQWVSRLNRHHMGLAWITLASLVVTDLYVALVSAGVLTDLRLVD
jgi:hypothetical protein